MFQMLVLVLLIINYNIDLTISLIQTTTGASMLDDLVIQTAIGATMGTIETLKHENVEFISYEEMTARFKNNPKWTNLSPSVNAEDWVASQLQTFLHRQRVVYPKSMDAYGRTNTVLGDVPTQYSYKVFSPKRVLTEQCSVFKNYDEPKTTPKTCHEQPFAQPYYNRGYKRNPETGAEVYGTKYCISCERKNDQCMNASIAKICLKEKICNAVTGLFTAGNKNNCDSPYVNDVRPENNVSEVDLRFCGWSEMEPPEKPMQKGMSRQKAENQPLYTWKACSWDDEIFRKQHEKGLSGQWVDAPFKSFDIDEHSGIGTGLEKYCYKGRDEAHEGCGANIARIVSPDGVVFARQPIKGPVWTDQRHAHCHPGSSIEPVPWTGVGKNLGEECVLATDCAGWGAPRRVLCRDDKCILPDEKPLGSECNLSTDCAGWGTAFPNAICKDGTCSHERVYGWCQTEWDNLLDTNCGDDCNDQWYKCHLINSWVECKDERWVHKQYKFKDGDEINTIWKPLKVKIRPAPKYYQWWDRTWSLSNEEQSYDTDDNHWQSNPDFRPIGEQIGLNIVDGMSATTGISDPITQENTRLNAVDNAVDATADENPKYFSLGCPPQYGIRRIEKYEKELHGSINSSGEEDQAENEQWKKNNVDKTRISYIPFDAEASPKNKPFPWTSQDMAISYGVEARWTGRKIRAVQQCHFCPEDVPTTFGKDEFTGFNKCSGCDFMHQKYVNNVCTSCPTGRYQDATRPHKKPKCKICPIGWVPRDQQVQEKGGFILKKHSRYEGVGCEKIQHLESTDYAVEKTLFIKKWPDAYKTESVKSKINLNLKDEISGLQVLI